MGRSTVYNRITSEETTKLINQENIELMDEFLEYLQSVDRSPKTVQQYKADLLIFFTFCYQKLNNKNFVDITKRDLTKFQNHCLNEWQWSPKRIRRVKSVISSLSTYIENMLDEEDGFEDFKSIIKKIESPANVAVREKTVLTDDEVELLLDTLLDRGKLQECCAFAILAYSGMRKAELLQMRPEFFDEDHLVFGSLHQTDMIRAKGRGRNGHQMKKWIMVQGDKYIMPWIEKRKELGCDCEWLFVTHNKNGWRKLESIDHYTEEASEIVGKDVYPHSLRHFVTTKLLGDYNLPSEVVREFFQWESVEMLAVYNDRSAADDFGKYFTADGIKKQESGSLNDLK